MGYIKMITGGVMAAIFIISLTLFAANFAIDNNSNINIIDDESYSSLNSTIRNSMSSFDTESETSQEIFFKTTLESGDEHASSGAQFKVGPLSAIGMAMSSFSVGFNAIFGPEFLFILITISSLITLIFGFYAIKAWLGRSPD